MLMIKTDMRKLDTTGDMLKGLVDSISDATVFCLPHKFANSIYLL